MFCEMLAPKTSRQLYDFRPGPLRSLGQIRQKSGMEDAFGDSAMGATFESFATPLDGDGTTADADITDEGQSDVTGCRGMSRGCGNSPEVLRTSLDSRLLLVQALKAA